MRENLVFNYQAVYDWLKKCCWGLERPHGECASTAFFVNFVFNWPIGSCTYHAWNKSPVKNNLILDLTSEQFYPGNPNPCSLVPSSTCFDGDEAYAEGNDWLLQQDRFIKEAEEKATWWVENFAAQIERGDFDGRKFGISQKKLLSRLKAPLKKSLTISRKASIL